MLTRTERYSLVIKTLKTLLLTVLAALLLVINTLLQATASGAQKLVKFWRGSQEEERNGVKRSREEWEEFFENLKDR